MISKLYFSTFYLVFILLIILPKSTKAAAINLNSATNLLSISSTIPSIPILPKSTVYDYQGSIVITIDNGQNQRIDYLVSFSETTTNCNYLKCFLGWITSYRVNGDSPVNGYPNAQGNQPIFRFDTNDTKNYKISYSSSLSQQWIDIITISCEKFNPYRVSSSRLLAATNDINLRRIINTQSIDLLGLGSSTGSFTQTAKLNDDKILNIRADSFNVHLASDQTINQEVPKQGQQPSLRGLVDLGLNLVDTNSVLNSKIASIYKQFQKYNLVTKTYNTINQDRITSAKLYLDKKFISQDKEPTIQLYKESAFPGEEKINLDIQAELKKAKTDASKFEVIQKSPTSQTVSKTLSIGNSKRLLQVYNLLNYYKLLYSKTVFGKTVSLAVSANCQLNLYSYYITCSSNLIYTIFGSTKILTIFSFTRSLSITWSWGNTYSGVWAFNFAVPLPPPVSFITINFYVGVRYYINLNLYAKWISFFPFKYQMRAVVETGIDVDARASLRVIVIEGGVYIRGTLVKVGTDPTVTLAFNFVTSKLYVNINWYFWFVAFQFEWGFFWRYWTFWSGWSSLKVIAKWTISGIQRYYPVLNTSFTLNL